MVLEHALVGELVPFVVETGGRLHAKSLRSLKELVAYMYLTSPVPCIYCVFCK